jgi:hypothetical protein
MRYAVDGQGHWPAVRVDAAVALLSKIIFIHSSDGFYQKFFHFLLT